MCVCVCVCVCSCRLNVRTQNCCFFYNSSDEFDIGLYVIKVKVMVDFLFSPLSYNMASRMKLKHVVYENILDEFDAGQCGMKIKVTMALAKFNHLIFQITSRCLIIADSSKRYSKIIYYTVRHVVGGKAKSVRNLLCI